MNKQDEEDDRLPEVDEPSEVKEEESTYENEDYGRNRMENFKFHARNVLLGLDQQNGGVSSYLESALNSARVKDIDIVNAYKELKKHMYANIGTKINEDVTANKSYLRSTIAI